VLESDGREGILNKLALSNDSDSSRVTGTMLESGEKKCILIAVGSKA